MVGQGQGPWIFVIKVVHLIAAASDKNNYFAGKMAIYNDPNG
jgi:hypothetical protein